MAFKLCGVVVLAMMLAAASVRDASAQGAYVSASLVGDLFRVSHAETTGSEDSGGGEALGFALRLGTELGSRWGVEVEYARPSEITSDESPRAIPLAAPAYPVFTSVPGGTVIPGADLYLPSYEYRIRTSQRNSTLSTAVWVRQEVSSRISLVYVGGVGFHRTEQDVEIAFQPNRVVGGLVIFPPIFPPSLTKTTTYSVGPLAGIEARIGLADHLQLVPGVRLHGLDNGWLVRTSVGLGWAF